MKKLTVRFGFGTHSLRASLASMAMAPHVDLRRAQAGSTDLRHILGLVTLGGGREKHFEEAHTKC